MIVENEMVERHRAAIVDLFDECVAIYRIEVLKEVMFWLQSDKETREFDEAFEKRFGVSTGAYED